MECTAFVKDKCNKDKDDQVTVDSIAITALDAKKYHAIFYVGGHGTMWDFKDDTFLKRAGETVWGTGGVVAAVCHGPAGLLELKDSNGDYIIKDKNVTGFTNAEEEAVQLTKVVPYSLEDEMKARGAKFGGADKWASNAVRDGNLVTGQNPASGGATARLVVWAINERFYGQKKECGAAKEAVAVKVLMILTKHNKLGDTGKQTGWYVPELAHPYYVYVSLAPLLCVCVCACA